MKQGPTSSELMAVVLRVPHLRQEAWERFTQLKPSDQDLIQVLHWRGKDIGSFVLAAGRMLIERNPSSKNLWEAARIDELHEQVSRLIFKGAPDREKLSIVIRRIGAFRQKAWEEFIKLDPTEDELLCIQNKVPEMAEQVKAQLEKRTPTKQEVLRALTGS